MANNLGQACLTAGGSAEAVAQAQAEAVAQAEPVDSEEQPPGGLPGTGDVAEPMAPPAKLPGQAPETGAWLIVPSRVQ